MNLAIVGGGINGLCTAWVAAQQGHTVTLYERDRLMQATSSASSKLLHGGLRYLENGELRLVRESLRERDGWIERVPELVKSLRLVMPIYQGARRKRITIAAGLFLYDHLIGKSILPPSKWLNAEQILQRDPLLKADGLVGGYEFSDAQMDDMQLGLWVAEQARRAGARLFEESKVDLVNKNGELILESGKALRYGKIINIAGPWAQQLLDRSGITSSYRLDLVRGSHLILDQITPLACLLEVPEERRIIFRLPWKGKTLIGTTEIRQTIDQPVKCSQEEEDYLLQVYDYYWPRQRPDVEDRFSGVRPLIHSAIDPGKATREYSIDQVGSSIITVYGGKWTTSLSLAKNIIQLV